MDTKLIKQKILDLAIRGKLVPQNPADEPASVLLERIKAEKAQLIKEGKIKKEKPLAPIEEVTFEIPESWEWCRLGSICSKFSTGPFGSMVHKTDYVLENGIPMINPANIINGSISKNKLMLVSIERSKELLNYRLNIDDVILARRGDLSKCAIISSQQEGWLCGTGSFFMHLLELEPRFFQVIYATSDIQSYLSSESVGATMDNLNQGLLSNMVIPIPPLEEQKRIVAEIDRWFKWIDELEQNQQDLHTAIKQAKSKILDLAIHGKLVPQESEWNVRTFSTVFKPLRFNQSKIAQREINKTGSYSVVTQSANFIEGYSNRYECLIKIEKPVLIFGDHTRNVKYIDFDFIIGADGGKVLSTCENPKFSYYLLLWASTQIENRGYSRHFQYLQKVPLLIPSANEQHRIVCKIEDLFAQLDKIEESLN